MERGEARLRNEEGKQLKGNTVGFISVSEMGKPLIQTVIMSSVQPFVHLKHFFINKRHSSSVCVFKET